MKKMKNIFFIVAIILLFLPFGIIEAENPTIGNPIESTASNIPQFIRAILDLVVKIGGPIVIFFIIYSGFLFVVARGNPEKINIAKTTLFWTIIGAVIILGAVTISIAISGTIDQIIGT